MTLTFAPWQPVDAGHFNSLGTVRVAHYAFAASITTVSSSFADLPAGTALAITKNYSNTALRVDFITYPFISGAAPTEVEFAVRINSVDNVVARAYRNEVSSRSLCSGVAKVSSSLAPGVYVAQPRWRRVSGTGTVFLDTPSQLYMMIQEVRI
jgi:hypothetical protein